MSKLGLSEAAARMTRMGITDLLDFEATHPRHTPTKEEAIRARGLTPARYYVLVARAAQSLEGQAHDAITAHRVTHRASAACGHRMGTLDAPQSATRHPHNP